MVLAVIFGSVFAIITHKLNLTSGVIPSMGMAMALINFFTVNTWNALLKRMNINSLPFTPQVLISPLLSVWVYPFSLIFPLTCMAPLLSFQ